MKEMKLEIVDKLGKNHSLNASFISAHGIMGGLGIKPGHTPLLTILKPGIIKAKLVSGEVSCFYASGGIMEIQPKIVTVLADAILKAKDINVEQAKKDLEDAKEALSKLKNESEGFLEVSNNIKELNARIEAADK